MKKLFTFLLTAVLALTAALPGSLSTAAAADKVLPAETVRETVEYFEDGSYAIVIVTEESAPMTRATTYKKTGSKSYTLLNNAGEELWRFTVTGVFTVNEGVSATCTSATYSISITDTAWSNQSASAYASGSQAIGDATFIRKLLGITVETKSCHVVLTCDAYGNLS